MNRPSKYEGFEKSGSTGFSIISNLVMMIGPASGLMIAGASLTSTCSASTTTCFSTFLGAAGATGFAVPSKIAPQFEHFLSFDFCYA